MMKGKGFITCKFTQQLSNKGNSAYDCSSAQKYNQWHVEKQSLYNLNQIS